jgi:basic membrane protein A and related proteins
MWECYERILRNSWGDPLMMTRSSFLRTFGLGLTALALVACSSLLNSPTPSSSEAPTSFRVALLLPGPKDDGSWNETGYQGLQMIQKELKAEIAYTEKAPEADFAKLFRQYAENKYDLIIGHGGQFIDAAEKVAQEFPRTKFAVIAQYGGNNKNLGALTFREGEMGYLAGAIAALKTKNQKIAYVGGVEYAHGREKVALFKQGAAAINPAIEVRSEWLGTWSDASKGRTVAQKLVQDGFDVIVADADGAGLGVHQAATKAGIKTLGWTADQYALAPKTILTSCIQQVPLMILKGAALAQTGQWEGKQYKFGLQEGVQNLAPFRGALTAQEEEQIDRLKQEVMIGKINTSPS